VNNIEIGNNRPFVLIAGPCVIESEDHAIMMCGEIKKICDKLNIPFIYKSSFDKANRTSLDSYRGLGFEEGLKILDRVRKMYGVPVLTDIHESYQAEIAAKYVDVIQIPAFLCRQTDLILAAAKTMKPLNIKKGQFLSPNDVKNIVDKIKSTGNNNFIITERGTSFGYNNLVVDMRSLEIMKSFGVPIVFDATHSVQLPGGSGKSSGGQRQYVPSLIRAACGVGVDSIFVEVHQDPDNAPSDGPNMVKLEDLEQILIIARNIDNLIKGN
ncbi:MAG: 3-deoxy-8-phosphooctulonate synthase, partial [Candidatus Thorarchaeota archaeon]